MPGLDAMKVKIGFDFSELKKGVEDASRLLSEVGSSAAQIVPSFTKSAVAADDLEKSLSKMANQGKANLEAMANKALGISPLLSNLSKNVADFGGGVTTSKVPEYFKKVSEEAGKASTALGTGVKGGSDRAGNALMNLGRIAQDAPFGFIGISNNINPLLESFQRLQKETGSTSGTLKALAGSMLGGGGIGLAVSVATGLLTVFAQHGLFKSGDEAAKAKKKIDEYTSSIKSIVSDLSKEATQISGLVSALQSDTLARQQKVTALKELQNLAPDYFGNLKMEHGLVNGLTAAYGAYLNALRERFKTKAIDNDLEQLFNKKLSIEVQLDAGAKTFLSKETTDRITRFRGQIEELGGLKILQGADFTKYTDAQMKVSSLQEAINTLQSKTKLDKIGDVKLSNDLNSVNKQIDGLLAKRGELANFDVKYTPDPKEKAHVKDLDDILKQLNEDLILNNKYASLGFISSSEQDVAKIAKVKSAIEEILKLKKGPGVNSPVIADLITSIKPEEIRQQLGERSKEIVKTLKTVSQTELYNAQDAINVNVPVNLKANINTNRALAEIDQKLKEDFNDLAKSIQKNVLNSGLSSIGETIGAAIGGGDVAGAFRGLLNVVIAGMKQLGEAMIGLGTAKSVLEKFNIAPGFGTIAAGIGIIALSSLIQSSLPKFADGTQGFRGGLAVVGERGREIVQLPQGSNVIPNHKLDGITGSGTQVFIPNISLRGSDLLIAFNRAQAQSNRRG